ncbi:MAG: hypothetical protein WC661_12320 [Opitutaceae bacterium]
MITLIAGVFFLVIVPAKAKESARKNKEVAAISQSAPQTDNPTITELRLLRMEVSRNREQLEKIKWGVRGVGGLLAVILFFVLNKS